MRVAIIAALPGELKQIVNAGFERLPASATFIRKWACVHDEDEWVAVCAGMGAEAARRAFAEAEASGPIDRVLSVGWAGALNEEVHAPHCFIASAVIDAQTGERFTFTGKERSMVLVSTARVADATEKRRLAAAYGGAMVDMESAAIVRLALMRGVPVCCVKAISDELGDTLPDFNRFIGDRGQMRTGALVRHAAVRPHHWRSLARLGRSSAAAAHNLASTVFTILSGPTNFDEINRTGNVDW